MKYIGKVTIIYGNGEILEWEYTSERALALKLGWILLRELNWRKKWGLEQTIDPEIKIENYKEEN